MVNWVPCVWGQGWGWGVRRLRPDTGMWPSGDSGGPGRRRRVCRVKYRISPIREHGASQVKTRKFNQGEVEKSVASSLLGWLGSEGQSS